MPSAARRLQVLAEQLAPRSCANRTGTEKPIRAHLICGGTMVVTGGMAGDHDIGYCRRKILDIFEDNEKGPIWATTSNDYSELERWLEPAQLLVSYCAAPFANDKQTEQLQKWLENGGKWIALHGSSGGIARRVPDSKVKGGQRKFVKQRFHDTLGAFFMNHPPIHEFKVKVEDKAHPITAGVGDFAIEDELYMVQLQGDMKDYKILLSTDYVYDGKLPGGKTFDPESYVFVQDFDPAPDKRTRVLGYERKVGKGSVVYFGMGHTGTPNKREPNGNHTAWENSAFKALMKNAIAWASSA